MSLLSTMILSFNLRKQEQKWHSKGVLVLVLCERKKKYRLRNQEVVMTYQEYRYPLTCVRGVLHRPWSSVRFPQWQYKLIIHPRLFHIAFVSYSISPHLIVIVWRLVIRETFIIILLSVRIKAFLSEMIPFIHKIILVF